MSSGSEDLKSIPIPYREHPSDFTMDSLGNNERTIVSKEIPIRDFITANKVTQKGLSIVPSELAAHEVLPLKNNWRDTYKAIQLLTADGPNAKNTETKCVAELCIGLKSSDPELFALFEQRLSGKNSIPKREAKMFTKAAIFTESKELLEILLANSTQSREATIQTLIEMKDRRVVPAVLSIIQTTEDAALVNSLIEVIFKHGTHNNHFSVATYFRDLWFYNCQSSHVSCEVKKVVLALIPFAWDKQVFFRKEIEAFTIELVRSIDEHERRDVYTVLPKIGLGHLVPKNKETLASKLTKLFKL